MLHSDDVTQHLYDAFISHASEDRKQAEELVTRLEQRSLRCWVAFRDATVGPDYGSQIIKGISDSRCFVVLLSVHSNISKHVQREVERAISKSKPIYPIRIEDVPLSVNLEYYIAMHHWLDIWPRLLDAHVDKVVQALQSGEKWTGNRAARRRNLILGAVAILVAIIMVISVLLYPSLRPIFLSNKQLAREHLRESNISIDADGIRNALATADGKILMDLTTAGITAQQFAAVLAQPYGPKNTSVAESFFDGSINAPIAQSWMDNILKKGLDPNLMVSDLYYGSQAILATALASGNTAAALSLLSAGAFPHNYQSLRDTYYETPRFLFPYVYLLDSDIFSNEDKKKIISAFEQAGAVNFRPASPPEREMTTNQLNDIDEFDSKIKDMIGRNIEETPPDRNIKDRPICRGNVPENRLEWCHISEDSPNFMEIVGDIGRSGIYTIELRNLVYISKTSGYFISVVNGMMKDPYFLPSIGIVQMVKDGSYWYLYYFTRETYGDGPCKSEEDGYTPARCWRRIKIDVHRQDGEAVIKEWSDRYRIKRLP